MSLRSIRRLRLSDSSKGNAVGDASAIEQTRLLISMQLASPIS
jgi:hypothetical protein